MPVRRAPFNIAAVNARRTAQVLRDLADLAERGEITGMAAGFVFADRRVDCLLAGVLEKDPVFAYYVAGKLKHQLENF